MGKSYDAVIIGSGIIGCCTAFELAKKGLKTLNVDKLAGAGHGSTSGSCAIVRLHYSTPDGVAMAREGYYYWIDWEGYLGVRRRDGDGAVRQHRLPGDENPPQQKSQERHGEPGRPGRPV